MESTPVISRIHHRGHLQAAEDTILGRRRRSYLRQPPSRQGLKPIDDRTLDVPLGVDRGAAPGPWAAGGCVAVRECTVGGFAWVIGMVIESYVQAGGVERTARSDLAWHVRVSVTAVGHGVCT